MQQPRGTAEQPHKQIPIVFQGLDELPIMFANQFLVQHQQSEFILAFGQIAPPIILPGTDAERQAQAAKINFVPANMLARFGLTEERMRELVQLLSGYLEVYDRDRGGRKK